MFLLLFTGLLAIGAVFGNEEHIDYSGVATRVLIENKIEWQSRFGDLPEVDSSEHGVTPGKRKTSCNCGWANRAKARIVGGVPYGRFEYPFIAGVSYSTYPTRPHCGSAIISSRHLLTAAHCTEKANGQIGLFVTLGEHERGMTAGSYTIPVDRLIQHPGYNPATMKHDISLLAVKNHLLMSSTVGPACLPDSNLDLAGKIAKTIGWGSNRVGGPMQFRPSKVYQRVVDMPTCNKIWPFHVAAYPATQLCLHAKGKTACQGDSGGPVVWLDHEINRYTIVGLVSFGAACSDSKPSIQTFVPAYLQWIMEGIKATSPSGQQLCHKI